MSAIREKALLLGERESMLGIASVPAAGAAENAPLFLLLNAGIVHRIGPHRMTVQLARELARAGFVALRVDLSGIGDSPARRDNLDFAASAQADIQELLTHLGSLYNTRRFVLAGLCSGADNAYQAAVVDERIVGAVLVDGYAYRTGQYYWRHYGTRVLRARSGGGLTRKVVKRLLIEGQRLARRFGAATDDKAVASASSDAVVPDYVREFPPRDEVAKQLQRLVDRGFDMLWVYTGGVARYYNYQRQFRDAFNDVNFSNALQVTYLANSNHTFTALRSRQRLVETVVAWARTTLV